MDARRFHSLVMLAALTFGASARDVHSSPSVPSEGSTQTNKDPKPALREQISSIPAGTLLQVRLMDEGP